MTGEDLEFCPEQTEPGQMTRSCKPNCGKYRLCHNIVTILRPEDQ